MSIMVAVKELHPNPFRAELGGYSNEVINGCIESYKMSDFGINMRFDVRQVDGKYQIVFGHHRWKALEKHYGKDHQVEIVIRDYDDDKMWFEMCRENLMRESNWFSRMKIFVATKKRLQIAENNKVNKGVEPLDTFKKKTGNQKIAQGIGGRQVAEALAKDGIAVSKDEVIKSLTIAEGLDPDLLKKVKRTDNITEKEKGDSIPLRTAEYLAKVGKKAMEKAEKALPTIPDEQKRLVKVLATSREQRVEEQGKLITQYKKLPDKEKEKILNGEVDLADLHLAKHKHTPTKSPGIDKMIKNFEGREIALSCDGLVKLLGDNPLHEYQPKEQALLVTLAKKLLKALSDWLAHQPALALSGEKNEK